MNCRYGEVAEPGLMHLTRNQTYLHWYRGFESLPLRHFPDNILIGLQGRFFWRAAFDSSLVAIHFFEF